MKKRLKSVKEHQASSITTEREVIDLNIVEYVNASLPYHPKLYISSLQKNLERVFFIGVKLWFRSMLLVEIVSFLPSSKPQNNSQVTHYSVTDERSCFDYNLIIWIFCVHFFYRKLEVVNWIPISGPNYPSKIYSWSVDCIVQASSFTNIRLL